MLKVQEFCRTNDNWRELLAAAPYCLKITEENGLVIFKYNQIESDFSNPIVCECRGLILEVDTFNVVAMAFKKFFNAGESYAAKIDWDSAVVSQKEDGSLMKVFFYEDSWKVATNGTIDALNANLNNMGYNNFRELFDAAEKNCGLDYDRFDPNYTYVFELCGKANQIVVPYEEPKLYHLATVNNATLEEINVDIGIEKPKEYKISSLAACQELVSNWGCDKEGVVVRDKFNNRIKVKGASYIRAHHMVNNYAVNIERALNIILENETSEFLSYFPQYREYFQTITYALNMLKEDITLEITRAKFEKSLLEKRSVDNIRKEFAVAAKKSRYSTVWFKSFDNVGYNVNDFINELRVEKLAELLNIYI